MRCLCILPYNLIYPFYLPDWLLTQHFLFPFLADRQRCVSFISSSCSYLWSGDWGAIYFNWGLNRVLAWGKYDYALFSQPIEVQCHNYLLMFLQDVKLLVEDLGELKPTIFCAVPRVLDRIYSGKLPVWAESSIEFGFCFLYMCGK